MGLHVVASVRKGAGDDKVTDKRLIDESSAPAGPALITSISNRISDRNIVPIDARPRRSALHGPVRLSGNLRDRSC